MTVLITMAGAGSRFLSQGYKVPKFMIKARDRSLFEWSLLSLKKFYDQKFIFACLAEHDANWIIEHAKILGISKACVTSRSKMSLGQAQTAYEALSTSNDSDSLLIYNIDTYIEKGLTPDWGVKYHGYVPVFESIHPGMSFVKYNSEGEVEQIAEKQRISKWATIGAYGFRSIDFYKRLYEHSYLHGGIRMVLGEQYIAPMYQLLLSKGQAIYAPQIDISSVHVLGTPEEVLQFDPAALPPFGS